MTRTTTTAVLVIAFTGALASGCGTDCSRRPSAASRDAVRTIRPEASVAAGHATSTPARDGVQTVRLEGGVLLVPPGSVTRLILLLDGMQRQGRVSESAKKVVASASAKEERYAVLIPERGAGLCDWRPDGDQWLCWPSRPSHKPMGGQLVVTLANLIRAAKRVLRVNDAELFVLGYSNGGFFASFLAVDAQLNVTAFAIISAGGIYPLRPYARPPTPTLLLAAESDLYHFTQMQKLRDELERIGRPATWRQRPGGHALEAADVAAALNFFGQYKTERHAE